MSVAPAVVVQQPLLVPPPISLVNSAVDATPDDERWINGFQYSPEACIGGQTITLNNCDPDVSTATKIIAAASDPITGTPYGIVAQDTCSTFSYQWRDYVARATRLLLAIESQHIAMELWTPNDEPNNIGLTNAPNFVEATSATLDPTVALGLVESQFMLCNETNTPMIHMSVNTFEQIAGVTGAGVYLTQVGNRWYTVMGSQIVVDRGYPGTQPGGGNPPADTEWIYASAPVQIRRGPIMVIPGQMNEAVLRRENQVTYRAERAAHASFDYNCCVVGARVHVTTSV
jgi:hypothetical protein